MKDAFGVEEVTDGKSLISLDLIEGKTSIEIFDHDTASAIIGAIEEQARSIVPDTSTAGGRKAIASLAHQVSKSKVLLDAHGKDLVAVWKSQAKAVDAERKVFRDRLDSLRDEVRAPLTEWEAMDQLRIAAEAAAQDKEDAHEAALVQHDMWMLTKRNEQLEREQEEREAEVLRHKLEAEAERERLEKAERQKARDKQAAADRVERDKKIKAAAKVKAEADKKKALAAAESKRVADIAAAESKRVADIAAANKAAEDKAAALVARNKAQAAQEEKIKQKNIADREKAIANQKLQTNVQSEIKTRFIEAGADSDTAAAIMSLIASNKIPYLTIDYLPFPAEK